MLGSISLFVLVIVLIVIASSERAEFIMEEYD